MKGSTQKWVDRSAAFRGDAVIERVADESGRGGDAELLLQVLAMRFRGGGGDPERFSDVPVASTRNDQAQNVPLTRR